MYVTSHLSHLVEKREAPGTSGESGWRSDSRFPVGSRGCVCAMWLVGLSVALDAVVFGVDVGDCAIVIVAVLQAVVLAGITNAGTNSPSRAKPGLFTPQPGAISPHPSSRTHQAIQ